MASTQYILQPTLRRIQEIEKGLPYRRLKKLSNQLDESDAYVAHLLQIAPRTLARRKQEGVLKPDESDRVDRIERIYRLAVSLYEEDVTQAVLWLKTPSRALANRTPLDFSRTEIGAREVEFLIGRLEYGVFS